MQTIEERSDGRWRPSPGSVYPTLAQLEDEGLIRGIERDGTKLFEITDAGREQARESPSRTAPVGRGRGGATAVRSPRSRPLVIQIGKAAWQVAQDGDERQVRRRARRWPRRAGRCTGSSPRSPTPTRTRTPTA